MTCTCNDNVSPNTRLITTDPVLIWSLPFAFIAYGWLAAETGFLILTEAGQHIIVEA